MKLTSAHDPDRIQATFDEVVGLNLVISSPTYPSIAKLLLLGSVFAAGALSVVVLLAIRTAELVMHRELLTFALAPAIMLLLLMSFVCVVSCIYTFHYELYRREVIQIDGLDFRIAWHGFLFRHRRPRVYSLENVRNLRYAPLLPRGGGNNPWSTRSVAFDYLESTVHFGFGVPESESRRIIETIKGRYKIAEDRAAPLPVDLR